MLQIVNLTPFQASLLVLPNEQGVESAYAIVKATFTIAPRVEPAKEQLPIVLADEFWGDPAASGLKYASDVALVKPAADVVLVGSAHAPRGKPVPELDVTLRVGNLSKTIRVFGDRTWKEGILSPQITAPEPFVSMPLTYERAFGGTDRSLEDKGIIEAEARNPVGVGFRGRKTDLPIGGTPLPNLEDPGQLITGPNGRPAPAGFGAICGHWEPRRSYAGTYDQAWQESRCPYLPQDFDVRFFQVAPPGQVAPGYWQGGEPVELVNASPAGRLGFNLPRQGLHITYTIEGNDIERIPNLDTLTLEPDENRFTMVWRTVLPCDKKSLKVRQILVASA
jgi:hypothetical protein